MGFAPLWWPLSASRQALRWRLPLAMPAHALLPAEHRLLQRVNLNEKREAQLEKDFYRVLLSN